MRLTFVVDGAPPSHKCNFVKQSWHLFFYGLKVSQTDRISAVTAFAYTATGQLAPLAERAPKR